MNKPYLVMLPGWGMDSYVWKPLSKMLTKDFELLFVEWHDLSSVDGYKEKVIQLIEQKKINSFSLLGWSLGSIVALEVAALHASSLNSIILISGTSRFTIHNEDQYDFGWHNKIVERMKFQLEKNQEETLLNFYKAMFSVTEKSNGQDQLFFRMIEENSCDQNTTSLLLGLNYLIQSDVRNELKHIHTPMLLIHGEEDQICPLGAAQYILNKTASITKLKSLAHTGHVPFFTNPLQCYENISEFVKACGKGALDDR